MVLLLLPERIMIYHIHLCDKDNKKKSLFRFYIINFAYIRHVFYSIWEAHQKMVKHIVVMKYVGRISC